MEHAQTLESRLPNESPKLVELLVGLAGEAHNERRSQGQVWEPTAELFDQFDRSFPIHPPLHPLEHS